MSLTLLTFETSQFDISGKDIKFIQPENILSKDITLETSVKNAKTSSMILMIETIKDDLVQILKNIKAKQNLTSYCFVHTILHEIKRILNTPYNIFASLDLKCCSSKAKLLEKSVILEKITVHLPKEIKEIQEILQAEAVIILTLEDKFIQIEFDLLTSIQNNLLFVE